MIAEDQVYPIPEREVMRFLADAGISPKTVEFLRRDGHDAVHVRELAESRGIARALASVSESSSPARSPIPV